MTPSGAFICKLHSDRPQAAESELQPAGISCLVIKMYARCQLMCFLVNSPSSCSGQPSVQRLVQLVACMCEA